MQALRIFCNIVVDNAPPPLGGSAVYFVECNHSASVALSPGQGEYPKGEGV